MFNFDYVTKEEIENIIHTEFWWLEVLDQEKQMHYLI